MMKLTDQESKTLAFLAKISHKRGVYRSGILEYLTGPAKIAGLILSGESVSMTEITDEIMQTVLKFQDQVRL